MINWIDSKSGNRVPSCDGRLIESNVNPSRDAKRWVEREAPFLKGFSTVVVMGIGSGLYIKELAKSFPKIKIICISKFKDLANAIENENIENVHAVHVESLLDLKKIKGIRTSTFGAFKVLRHPGEYRIESSFYDECTRFITARSVAGLSWALSERSDLRRVLRRFETGAGWGVRPLSIVDLNRMIGDENIPVSREVKIIRSLRELVK